MSKPEARRQKKKKANPLTTPALAMYLSWKQLDLLLLVSDNKVVRTPWVAEAMSAIQEWDEEHGGAFYRRVRTDNTYSSLRTLEARGLVLRHRNRGEATVQWAVTKSGRAAVKWMEEQL